MPNDSQTNPLPRVSFKWIFIGECFAPIHDGLSQRGLAQSFTATALALAFAFMRAGICSLNAVPIDGFPLLSSLAEFRMGGAALMVGFEIMKPSRSEEDRMANQYDYSHFDGVEPGEDQSIFGNRLHYAIRLGDLGEVKKLLGKEACDPNKGDMRGITPLMVAAYHGQASCVRALLADPRVDPNQQDRLMGRTALIVAAEAGSLACVRALRKASDLGHESSHKANALQTAAAEGNAEIVQYLSKWSDPRAINSKGESALVYAAESGSLACLRFLMPLSDVQALDNSGCNALMRAAAYGRRNVVMELLPHVAVEAKNHKGQDALALAKESLKAGWAEDSERVRETVEFLTAYKHSMREMSLLSKMKTGKTSSAPKSDRSVRI